LLTNIDEEFMKDFLSFKDEFEREMGFLDSFSQVSTDEPPTTAKKKVLKKVIPQAPLFPV
jgi:hypothetical protein